MPRRRKRPNRGRKAPKPPSQYGKRTAAPTKKMSAKRRRNAAPQPVTTRWVEPTPNVGPRAEEPATPKQLEFVKKLAEELFVDPPEVVTRRDASMAIGRLKQTKKRLQAQAT